MDHEEAIRKFDEAHGARVQTEMHYIYEDGAVRQNAAHGVLQPPSRDLRMRYLTIAKYWSIRLDNAVNEFDTYKKGLLRNAINKIEEDRPGGLPCDPGEAKAELLRLREIVIYCKGKLEAAQRIARTAEVGQTTDVFEENRARLSSFVNDLKAITI